MHMLAIALGGRNPLAAPRDQVFANYMIASGARLIGSQAGHKQKNQQMITVMTFYNRTEKKNILPLTTEGEFAKTTPKNFIAPTRVIEQRVRQQGQNAHFNLGMLHLFWYAFSVWIISSFIFVIYTIYF